MLTSRKEISFLFSCYTIRQLIQLQLTVSNIFLSNNKDMFIFDEQIIKQQSDKRDYRLKIYPQECFFTNASTIAIFFS